MANLVMVDQRSMDMTELATDTANALTQVAELFRREHPGEQMYSFGPYTSPDVSYLGVAILTEAGLATAAASCHASQGGDLTTWTSDLRWSPADSPFDGYREDKLRDVSRRFGNHCQADRETYHKSSGQTLDDHCGDRLEARLDALQGAMAMTDRTGVFDGVRDQIVLSVWAGDQSDEDRLRHAKALNPSHVYERFVESYTLTR